MTRLLTIAVLALAAVGCSASPDAGNTDDAGNIDAGNTETAPSRSANSESPAAEAIPAAEAPTVKNAPSKNAPSATVPGGEGGEKLAPNALAPNAVVERVVDGDTLVVVVNGNGERERVRLLGIDTPESVAESRPDQCYGAESSAYLTQLLPAGTEITLIRDIEARDQYDRMLAYVVRSSDQLFVNLDLIENGFADTLIYEPNSYYRDLFESAEAQANANDMGLWGVCGGPDVPLE